MSAPPLRFVICGLSITSSWGNGHATTYRALVRELTARGHDVLFLERDMPWYAENRDLPNPPYGTTQLYQGLEDLQERFAKEIGTADCVIVGSYVPEGVTVGQWVTETARGLTAFYDIDTPVTLAKLQRGDEEYLAPWLIPRYGLYLSFSGGPILQRLEKHFGSPMARVLYCSVDPELYFPEEQEAEWDLGYLGTYSADRQPKLEQLLLKPSREWEQGRFAVAGPLYPSEITWPANVRRIDHLPPHEHRSYYNRQRFTLNVTREDMVRAGYSPSVRLFEAAACGTPIVSDYWAGLETIFTPGQEILVAQTAAEALSVLREAPEKERRLLGKRARRKVLARHTAAHRALEVEEHVMKALNGRREFWQAACNTENKGVNQWPATRRVLPTITRSSSGARLAEQSPQP